MFYNASSASAFVDRIGVNVHVSWPGVYPYADTAKVISAMNYLGLQNMRDYMNADTVGIYNKLADAGFHFDLMYNQRDNLAGYVTQVHNLEVAHPGSVLTLEGVNEINNNISSAIAWQKDIFTRVNADPVLANKPVIAPSLSGSDPAVYGQLQVGAYSDYGNIHEYWGNGQPAYGWSPSDSTWWWSTWVKDGQISVPGKPVAVTETGISTANAGGGVDPTVQAKEILNAVMDAAKNGAPFTYLYELASSQNAGPSDPESNFGLYNYDWTAKPAAVALHNFTSILTDGGDLSGPAGGLDYAIQGVPQWGGQMLFQEGDGSQDIVVWAEPDIWNEGSRTVVAAPNTPITIDLATAASVAIYDPMKGSTPVQVLGTTSHITFNVTDHPLIVEIKPVSGSSGVAASTSPVGSALSPQALIAPAGGGALVGGGGADTLQGDANGVNSLRGMGGDDVIYGGSQFNDVNGNVGNDTIFGSSRSGDSLMGGQGGDLIDASQATGHNMINGNKGADTIMGGLGGDTLYGGQGDDRIIGGPGADWISGDLGNDTLTGGGGADTFRAFANMGQDQVTDFDPAEGDRVQIDAGLSYSVSVAGADTVVTTPGGQLVLAGVQLSSTTGWLVAS